MKFREDIDEIQEDIDEIVDDEDEDEHKEKKLKKQFSRAMFLQQEIKELKGKFTIYNRN